LQNVTTVNHAADFTDEGNGQTATRPSSTHRSSGPPPPPGKNKEQGKKKPKDHGFLGLWRTSDHKKGNGKLRTTCVTKDGEGVFIQLLPINKHQQDKQPKKHNKGKHILIAKDTTRNAEAEEEENGNTQRGLTKEKLPAQFGGIGKDHGVKNSTGDVDTDSMKKLLDSNDAPASVDTTEVTSVGGEGANHTHFEDPWKLRDDHSTYVV
jgi:hypothetical protein